MRHLTCHLQEVPRDLPSLSDKLQDTRVKWYKRGPRLDPKPPATSAHPHRLLMYPCSRQARACARQLTLSHMDVNCGFWQMFVQPIAHFGTQGIWCHLLGDLEISVRF